MSTSLLVTDMEKLADKDTLIRAVALSEIEDYIEDYDVVLIGPQLRYKLDKIKVIADNYRKSVDLIDAIDYGRINGYKILESAKEIYKKKHKL